MTVLARSSSLSLMLLALVGSGCGQTAVNDPTYRSQSEARPEVPPPVPVPATAERKETKLDTVSPQPADTAAPPQKEDNASETPAPQTAPKGEVKLEKVNFDEFLSRIAANKQAKYTMVDAWATWCAPCVENFPHVVEMHNKYTDKGLAVVSLSFDDPADAKQVSEAEKFLVDKQAKFTNFVLDEETGVGFEKLDINAIPAVFIYDSTGKQVKKFTLDDPNNQFTYDEVEQTVADLLAGKTASR